jgi:hypothetical protein
MIKKLNPAQILSKAGNKYKLLKDAKYGLSCDISPEIRSDQIKAVVEVLCEEINKILERK